MRLAQVAAQFGTWEWDPVNETSVLSAELHHMFGTEPGNPRHAQEWASRVHPADWPSVQQHIETGQRSNDMEFEYRYLHPERGLRWFYCKGRRLHGNSPFFGVLLDVTDRKQAELRLEAQHKVSRALANSADLAEAAPQILGALCDALDWRVGALWSIDAQSGTLRCVEWWPASAGKFGETSRRRSFSPGVGLPGTIWASGEPLWIQDVAANTDFPGLAAAATEGLHAAVGYPILLRGQVLGVLEFFSEEIRQPDAALLQTMSAVGAQIGQYIDRVRTEEALRHNEEEFRALANSIPQLVWMANPDGWIFWYNQRWYEYTGTTPQQMEGWGWQSVHDPSVLPAVMERWQTSIAAGQPFEMTFPLRGADGIFRPFLTRIIPVRDSWGAVRRWFGTNTDVSTEVRIQEELRQSQERLRAALAASGTGTYRWSPHTGEFLEFDDNLKVLFGLRPEENVRHTEDFLARVHADDLAALLPAVEACRQGADFEFEYRVLLPDGSIRWLYDRGKMEWAYGRPAYLVGACTDISGRKQMEDARHRLAAIVASSDDAIISKDLNGIIQTWNGAAERMFGYTAAEIVGRPITTIIPPELHGDERRILATIARGDRIEHFETVRVTKSGERIDVSLTVSPLKDDRGRIIGAAKIARDITQRKKTEQALRTTERLASVGRLAATVAHEINNPLEAIINLVYLAKHTASSEEVRDYLSRAEEELERVSHLTKQTLGFYRDTKGAAPVKIGSLIGPLLSIFSSRARGRKIEIRPEIRHDPEIAAVPGEIRQVVANLLSNSIDAVGAGGLIRICVSPAAGRRGVRITVADSGPGIPPAIRPKLFEPFFTTKKEVGTGLGLWVCKSIVEKHGGTIRVRSSIVPGRNWTVFSVFLPENPRTVAANEILREAV